MKCNICDKLFETKSQMANHVRWIHKREDNISPCKFCNKKYQTANIISHQNGCRKNPQNITLCLECGKECYHSKFCNNHCSNSYNNKIGKTGFQRMVNDGNHPCKGKGKHEWTIHRKICFKHWEEKCAICGWNLSVDVHHIDSNNKNNDPKNLIPLCRNHHMLTVMTEHKKDIDLQILEIVKKKFGVID